MFKNKKPIIGIPGGLALGLLVSMLVTLAGTGMMALLVTKGTAGEGSSAFFAASIQLLSAAIGAFTTAQCVKKMRLQVCLLSGGIYYLALLGITALCFDGEYASMGLPALMVLIGSGVVAFAPTTKLSVRRKQRRKYH